MYTEYLYNNSLAHHGIKGQKWGKLNGPPYPLDYKQHSVIEKRENPKNKIDGTTSTKSVNTPAKQSQNGDTNNQELKQKKKLTDKQKKALKIAGAAIVTTAVVGLSIYAIKKYGNNKNVKDLVNKTIFDLKDETLDGFMDITNSKSNKEVSYSKIKDALKKCNPGFDNWDSKDKYNCGNACLGAEAQIRGINVFARKNTKGLHIRDIAGCFKDVDSKQFADANKYMPNVPFEEYKRRIKDPYYAKEHSKQVKKAFEKTILESFPDDNARGVFDTNLYGSADMGHWMMWVKEGNSVTFLNPQKDVSQNLIDQYFSKVNTNSTTRNTIFRFDNLEFDNNMLNNFVSSSTNEQIYNSLNSIQKGTNFILKLK